LVFGSRFTELIEETKQRAIRLVMDSVKDSHSGIHGAAIESLTRLAGQGTYRLLCLLCLKIFAF
jgi:glycosidase